MVLMLQEPAVDARLVEVVPALQLPHLNRTRCSSGFYSEYTTRWATEQKLNTV